MDKNNEISNESIYSLLQSLTEAKVEEKLQYTSKYHDKVKQDILESKRPGATMGRGPVQLKATPTQLKVEEKAYSYKHQCHKRECLTNDRKPPVPSAKEAPPIIPPPAKDHITNNAWKVIKAVPKIPQPRYVDTPKGSIHNKRQSGLSTEFMTKPGYGKIPGYLQHRKQELLGYQQQVEIARQNQLQEKQNIKELSDEERQEVLQGLKRNWDEIYRQYAGMSLIVDTIPKMQRKERLEAEMNQLEKDIEMLEKHKRIFVANTNQYGYIQ